MKTIIKQLVPNKLLFGAICLALFAIGNRGYAQDSTASGSTEIERVPFTFRGNFVIDNQTVDVAPRNTFEFDIQHRFGTINNAYDDMYGVFAPANIRLGVSYVIIKNLQVGFGITKEKMQWDGNIKYAISQQAVKGGCPISVTFYGNFAASSLPKKGNFVTDNDRISYFSQLMIARKVTEKFSVQVAPSLSYFNNVAGYRATDGTIKPTMLNYHVAIATSGCYMLTDVFGLVANYDQPLTQHKSSNPHPNVSFGIQVATASHTFQVFLGNYQSILQQSNNMYNQNNYLTSRYCLGFNITKRFFY
jgi:hypothetical protein